MRNRIFLLGVVAFSLTTFHLAGLLAQDQRQGNGQADPPAHVHWAKGQAPPSGGSGSSPNMTWHGGNIMPAANVVAIFWGKSWATKAGDKISTMDAFYSGIGNSSYANTADEYGTGAGTPPYVTGSINVTMTDPKTVYHVVDTSAAPATGNQTGPILAEVCKVIQNPPSDGSGYYPVYVDSPRKGSYCAWHSSSSCSGVPVQFAFFYNLDGDAGCDPQSSVKTYSQGAAAIANVSGHELSEARTDPKLNAWYDQSGAENADKCAWTFGSKLLPFTNGSMWKIQGNWSNNAYTANTGYTSGTSVVRGCIDGTN